MLHSTSAAIHTSFSAIPESAPGSLGNSKTSALLCTRSAPSSAPLARSTNPIPKTRGSFPRAAPPLQKIPTPLSSHSYCRSRTPAQPARESAAHLAPHIVHPDTSLPPIPAPNQRTLARSLSTLLRSPASAASPDSPGGTRPRAAPPHSIPPTSAP